MFEQIFILLVVLFSIVIHEISHGFLALSLGDPTAKLEGRLTLNPIKHIDFFGTILVPLFLFVFTMGQGPIFGWAKPVPVNPFNLRDKRYGMLKVSIAGPLSNLILATIFALFLRIDFFKPYSFPFTTISIYNFMLAFFNLLPVPPLDGYHLFSTFFPYSRLNFFLWQYGPLLLLLIIIGGLNLIFLFSKFLFSLLSGIPF